MSPSVTGERPDFSGRWQVIESENFEEFLHATGAPWVVRKTVGKFKSTCEIQQDGDSFHINVSLLMFSREESFDIGVEFTVKQPNGMINSGKAAWDGEKLVIDYKPLDGVLQGQQIVREFIDEDHIRTTMTTGGVTATRISRRVAVA